MSVRHDNRVRQSGVALITVLLIVAVLVTVVSRLSFANQIWLRQADNATTTVRAAEIARAARHWIRIVLEGDDPGIDSRSEHWARTLPPLPVGGGSLTGRIDDLQSRFNVNNLVSGATVNPVQLERFQRLLRILEIDPQVAYAVVDWIDTDGEQSGAWGAEDGFYLGLNPPCLTANRPISDVRELRLVRGIYRSAWTKLAPHISALPSMTAVNVNTATVPVLAAAITNWGAARSAVGRAERWAQQALTDPAPDLETFAREVFGAEVDVLPPGLSVATRFFEADLVVRVDRRLDRSLSVFDRGGERIRIVSSRRSYE